MEFVTNIGYIFCFIFTIFAIYMLCLAFCAVVSRTKDISNTELGKSIIGNVYETTIPVSFECSLRDVKKFNLTKYEINPSLMNPAQWSYYIKIPSGIKFKVIKVEEHIGIDSGTNLNTTIKLLNNIPNDSILEYVEADIDDAPKFPRYIKRDILKSENPNLNKIFDKNIGLKTKNLILGLYCFQFFDYEHEDIVERNPIKHNETIIKLIE